jgi:hypothetical protein
VETALKGEALLSTLAALSVKERVSACYDDPVLFCRYYLEHMFPAPIPPVHRGLLAIDKTDCFFRGIWRYRLDY